MGDAGAVPRTAAVVPLVVGPDVGQVEGEAEVWMRAAGVENQHASLPPLDCLAGLQTTEMTPGGNAVHVPYLRYTITLAYILQYNSDVKITMRSCLVGLDLMLRSK